MKEEEEKKTVCLAIGSFDDGASSTAATALRFIMFNIKHCIYDKPRLRRKRRRDD